MAEELNFRKRPVIIQAVQWTGENLREVICFTDGPLDARSTHASMKWEDYCDLVKSDGLKIYTLEGKMSADVGDWIIKGVKGEHYPCKPDVFELTYEPARTQPPSLVDEPVEVVGWRRLDRPYELTADPSVCAIWHGVGYPVQALYTHPAASVPAGCKVVPVELLEQIAVELEHDNDRYFLGRELRALLASAEGVKDE